MKVDVRQAIDEDAQTIVDILTQATTYKNDHHDHAWGKGVWSAEEIAKPLQDGFMYLVAVDGEPAGTFRLNWQDDYIWGVEADSAGYVHLLAVKNGYHGRGIGKYALDWASQQTAKQGYGLLRLDCGPQNVSLCNYYESLGFERVALKEVKDKQRTYVAALYERQIS